MLNQKDLLDIPDINILSRVEDDKQIVYCVESKTRPQSCSDPYCDCSKKPAIHSKREVNLIDTKEEGKPRLIKINKKRYRCPWCEMIIADEFSFYEKRSKLTNRLKEEFVERRKNGESYNQIAKDYQIDHKTVKAAIREEEAQ